MSAIDRLLYVCIPMICGFFSSFHELMQSRGVRRPSVCLSVNFAQIATSTTNMTRSPPNLYNMVPTWACIQDVLKVKVKVKGHMIRTLLWCHEMFAIQYLLTLSLHALTLWSTVTLSFQYKCQAARCIVYIMEWATPSLTVWWYVWCVLLQKWSRFNCCF